MNALAIDQLRAELTGDPIEGRLYRATVRGVPDVLVSWRDDQIHGSRAWRSLEHVNGFIVHYDTNVTDVVGPLVVLDLPPDAGANIKSLLECARGVSWSLQVGSPLDVLADALEEQIEAQTRPARMAEPGWGVRVTASSQHVPSRQQWVGICGPGADLLWVSDCGERTSWDALIDPQPAP